MAFSKIMPGEPAPIADSIAQLQRRWRCSRPHILDLIKRGELEDFWDGRIHKILRYSSDAYITRQLGKSKAARQLTAEVA